MSSRLFPLDGAAEHRLIELLRKTPASVVPAAIGAAYTEPNIRRIVADLQALADHLAATSALPILYLRDRP